MCSVPGVPTPGSEVSVVITKVNLNQNCGLVELWVNMNSEIKHVYEQMREEIQIPKRNFCVSEGKAGDLCLVNADEKWHRARIVSMEDEKYNVFLIDQGQPHSTTSEALAWGKDECFILPPEIESCVLANVLSVEDNWPDRATNFLKSLPGKEFKGLVQHALMPDRTILLDLPTISKHLCKEGVAKKIPVGEFKNLVLKCLNLPKEDASESCSITKEQSLNVSNQLENNNHYFCPELLTSTFETIRVTEVVDPGNIFCELVIFSKAIKILSEQMNEDDEDKSIIDDLQPQTIGMPCAAKGLDGKWRRAILKQQIASKDATVEVMFVDEGKTELVQATDIKHLHRKFLRMPVVTYNCSLEGVSSGKGWTKEETDYLKSLILNETLVARFEHHNLPEDSYSVSLYAANAACINDCFLEKKELDLNSDAKQKFTHNLIMNGAASDVASPSIFAKNLEQDSFIQSYNSPFSPMEMPLCDLLTVGSSVGVKISCIESLKKFWCQTVQSDKKLEVLMKDLQTHYASAHPKPLVESICVARNPDNNMWYRAKIIANRQSPDVEVRFIDYGQTKKVPLRELRPIDPTFLRLDAQAFQCALFNLPDTDITYANEEFQKFIDSCSAQNSGLKCVVKAVASDKEGLLLNMVDIQTQSESASQVLAEKCACRPNAYNHSTHNIDINSKEKIWISYSESVHHFYCQLDRNSHLFTQVMDDVEKFVCNSVPPDCTLAPNSLCIVRYNDLKWFRGQVISPDLKVHFIDYGKTLALNKSDIQPFPCEASFARTIPVLAIPLGLYNIPEEVPQEINEWFARNVVGNTFTMSVLEKGANGKLMVELFDGSLSLNAQVREKIVNAAKVDNVNEDANQLCNGSETSPVSRGDKEEIGVSQSDVAQQNGLHKSPKSQNMEGLAIASKFYSEMQNSTALEKSPVNTLDGAKKMDSNIPFEENCTSNLKINEDKTKTPPTQTTTSPQNRPTVSPDRTLQNCVYKKPIVSINKTQELHASSISGPDYFWCQCSNTDDLDKVTRLAQKEGQAEQDPFFPLTLITWNPCLALYNSDNQWYRAQVIRKNKNTFSVLFIDYGNEADIDFKDVRPLSPSLLEVAPQAFLCCLDGIDESKDQWDDAFYDKFYYLLVDKPLKVKVLSMGHNSEIQVPQCTVQIDDVGVHKLLQKYGQNDANALNKSPQREIQNVPKTATSKDSAPNVKLILYKKPNILVNKTVEVYASSISGPGYFWCQYSNTGELDRITQLAQQGGWAEDPVFPETLGPGSPCLALYSSDNRLYRAQVISREKNMLSVVFVDYGNEEDIHINDVRPLPPSLSEIQPQAFLCCLENFDESVGTWDDALYDYFHSRLVDKLLKVKVIAMEHNEEVKVPHYTVQFDFDVNFVATLTKRFWKQNGQKVPTDSPRRENVLQNVQKPSQKTPAKISEVNVKVCKYNKPSVLLNKTVMVYASSVFSPEYFWCQYSIMAELDKVTKLAQIEGRAQQDPNFAKKLVPGSPCLALFCSDNLWYRAQILSKSKDIFSVLFIDYGNEADIHIKHVRPLSQNLLEVPPQAFLCCLEGFDLHKGAWYEAVYDDFHNLLVDKLFKVTPSRIVDNPETALPQFVVQIQRGNTAVNKAMQKYWKANHKMDNIQVNKSGSIGQNNLNIPKQNVYKKPNVSLNRIEEVYPSCIGDPHYFWCQFADSVDLNKITKLAQDAGRSQQRPKTLNNGDLCLALYSSDNQWYRALVSQKNRETVNVVFVDYGNEADGVKDIRVLPQNLLDQPPQAFLCSLHGFEQSRGTWDDQVYDDFYNMLVDKCLKVKIITVGDNPDIPLPQYSVQIECEGANVNKLMEKYWRGAADQASQSSGKNQDLG